MKDYLCNTKYMQSQTLSDRRIDEIRGLLRSSYGVDPLPEDALIRRVEYGDGVLTVDGEPAYFYDDDDVIPLLSTLLTDTVFLPVVTIDMGAVPPISSGADLMCPGVVDADEDVRTGDIVAAVDEDNEKPIAVARTTVSGEDLVEKMNDVGAVSLHHVGDELWDEFCA